jgi:Domain of unknown function (DUF4166)/Saccharopine dehydrogenase NADP binding domain
MTVRRLKILILGGYGTFGGRLAQLLADEDRLTLVIGGRSHAKATAFCARLQARATAVPLAFERDREIEPQLRQIAPDMVVDASGPFQSYGADPYRVVKAAIALGIDYLDLADSSGFVEGITQFDADARGRGLLVLAGVSSFPVLTAAVIRRLAQGMARIDAVIGGIAPSPHANVGLNVIRAIASYAGRPIAIVRDGQKTVGYALIETRRYTIAPPGCLPLHPVRFSLVDVPDLQVLPDLWPSLRSAWIGVGPVPEIWHRVLNALAWTVRLRLLPSLLPLAGPMYATMNRLSFGEHRGGMFVALEGVGDDGQRIERSWHLLAEGDAGPLIPSMAAEAIVRRCLADKRPQPGARAAATDLELADYEALFERRRISTGRWQTGAASEPAPLYRRMLGEAWGRLPPPLQEMHEVNDVLISDGTAVVERGRGLMSRLLGRLMGFPPAGRDVPVTVTFRAENGREHWRRDFGNSSFASTQEPGRGHFDRLLCERFGPVCIGLALVVEEGRLRLVVRRWSFAGLPLPAAWAPRGQAYEFAADGRFRFHVEIAHPFTGLIVRYRGWLAPRA